MPSTSFSEEPLPHKHKGKNELTGASPKNNSHCVVWPVKRGVRLRLIMAVSSSSSTSGNNERKSLKPSSSSSSSSSSTSTSSSFDYLINLVWLGAVVYGIGYFLYYAYQIRLQAIKEYGPVIHEFDPYFNWRATQVRRELLS
jgi:hypothetical protein